MIESRQDEGEVRWRFRAGELRFPRPCVVMGIVNVTPDSFAGGGVVVTPAAAIEKGMQQAADGAELLDVGGESSRPGAVPVSAAEELARVIPVIAELTARTRVPISVDTQKPEVAVAALRAGASVVNDVAANREDPAMWAVVAEAGAGYVAMHMQGTPATMQRAPRYEHEDVVGSVERFFEQRIERLERAGVAPAQVALDPGIGFGKRLEHNLALLASLSRFRKFGRPLVLGASRKSFMGALLGVPVEGRLPASLACACWAALAGVELVRVHDVGATVQAVRMTEAIRANRRA